MTVMIISIFYIILISFAFNFLLYLWYKFYLYSKIVESIEYIKKYEDRLSSIRSEKRRNKVLRNVSPYLKQYESKLRNYIFIQSLTLIFVYMIGLFIVIYYITPPYAYFPYPSIFTPEINGRATVNNLFIYIVSFLLFTPLSLRRPKLI